MRIKEIKNIKEIKATRNSCGNFKTDSLLDTTNTNEERCFWLAEFNLKFVEMRTGSLRHPRQSRHIFLDGSSSHNLCGLLR